MEIGIDSFAYTRSNETGTRMDPMQAMAELLERMEHADACGLDVFGIGEHHREEYLDAAPVTILAAAAARTRNIKLTSAVTVLSAADPVRVFQSFAALDLISQGRAEMVVGRGSSIEAFPLFGFELNDYDALFAEKLGLLLHIRENEVVSWSGKFRPAIQNLPIYPRPVQPKIPIWLGVGGTPNSFARAGMLGLPLMIAVIGGETHRFRPLVDLYREAWLKSGHPEDQMQVGLHSFGYLAESMDQAVADYYPGHARNMNRIGRERGWPPMTMDRFNQSRSPLGFMLIGDPEEVAEKILRHSEALGGIDRLTFQMDNADLSHEQLKRSIELIGTKVKPLVNQA
ncbi:LLM class flavin-dependent oxidoreductase [Flavilitoribacter nigricans]|uniref:LLM class flavin-dependent oxidoreductase n=1 Tax=Flavilitoribacter nigricans (strain ATCC 23147 / DSM 23189 / NBRC 102662 / NCIMB 1420 / SS-2) TaxID=1122177 RepID=A0A2D0NIM5_FLAN2|nr:LLM class flavin-dependent oxidoreductase [Flavilitoribacter nigricans]PHN08355.1 LLM class flavin-dependent oxidoreductase [Flavilitoribacter nigricans DSM 23189 = NBRC 102662]